ncbi:MAG: hypothetical protein HQ472_05145 [Ignavibacteria bacterium]|nr:hypothetical protein [Ignavibacteria bacterium]
MEVVSPSGCADANAINAAINDGRLRDGIYKVIANKEMAKWTADPECCPCPSTVSLIYSKVANCMATYITWETPGGGHTTQSYDPTISWSTYLMLIQASWFPLPPPTPYANASVGFTTCLNNGCCYRVRTFCKSSQSQVQFWDGPWLMQGPPCTDPIYNNCKVVNCVN